MQSHPEPTFGRHLSADDDGPIARLMEICFGSSPEDARRYLDRTGREHFRVLREDGAVSASLARVPMGIYFGGRSVPMLGIAAVGVGPEARGRGLAGRLMREAMLEASRESFALAGLYPATQPLYRRVGFEQAGHRFEVRIPLSRIDVRERGGEVRATAPDDEPLMKTLYEKCARGRAGWLDRGEYVWRRVFEPAFQRCPGYLVGRDGTWEGYLLARTQRRGPLVLRQEVIVHDLVWTSAWSLRRLLGLLADFGSLAEEAVLHAGPAHPALLALGEQRWQMRALDAWMLRILDVRRALEERGYGPIEGAAVLHVRDPLVPSNEGSYHLTVERGRGRVSHARRDEPGASMDVRGLAGLYGGMYSAEDLVSAGLMEGDPSALAAAGAIFAGPAPATPDMY